MSIKSIVFVIDKDESFLCTIPTDEAVKGLQVPLLPSMEGVTHDAINSAFARDENADDGMLVEVIADVVKLAELYKAERAEVAYFSNKDDEWVTYGTDLKEP
jgi:hypothetical protein